MQPARDSPSPQKRDYLFAAAGAWGLWLVATSIASAVVDFGALPDGSGAETATLEASLMLFSRTGLLLVLMLQFVLTPILVHLLRRDALSRIAIYMMLYAMVWLAIMVSPMAALFGITGILRQMAWLTLFMLWGGWNWWALAQRPRARWRRERVGAPASAGANAPGTEHASA